MEQTKIKNAIDFYCLANQLKYKELYTPPSLTGKTQKKEGTYSNHIYGSLILAIAFNSEFKITENIGKVIRMIALTYLKSLDEKKFTFALRNLSNGSQFFREMEELGEYSSKEAVLALQSLSLDACLNSLYLSKKDITPEELYYKAIWNNDYISPNLADYDSYIEILKFYCLNQNLKNKDRSAWDKNHWNIKTSRIESIAEHVYGTIILALALDSEFDFHVDIDEVVETLAVHEIGEILIGDITPFDNVTPAKKAEIEHQAMFKVLGNLSNKGNLIKRLFEFDSQATKNAEFAYWCDKLEANLQSKIYQEMNLHCQLQNNPNNITLKNPRVGQMIQEGAKTAFDIWYEWDKDKFTGSPILVKSLKYIKENSITER